jgi:hypothetical protein
MPVILATQEAEIKRIVIQSQPGQIVCKTLSQKRKGLVEWLKVKALSSCPSIAKKKKKKRPRKRLGRYSGQGTEPKRMAELSNYK